MHERRSKKKTKRISDRKQARGMRSIHFDRYFKECDVFDNIVHTSHITIGQSKTNESVNQMMKMRTMNLFAVLNFINNPKRINATHVPIKCAYECEKAVTDFLSHFIHGKRSSEFFFLLFFCIARIRKKNVLWTCLSWLSFKSEGYHRRKRRQAAKWYK